MHGISIDGNFFIFSKVEYEDCMVVMDAKGRI